jgi:hypothetical protein
VTILKSEEWSQAHEEVSEALSTLLNRIRDLGYNPSLHIHYENDQHRLTLDDSLLKKHPELQPVFDHYLTACDKRDSALAKIQELPKLDIGF